MVLVTGLGHGASFAIVETGQTACYDTAGETSCPSQGQRFFGQDAQYRTHPLRYEDNGDGTVTDLVTGLMWQQGLELEKSTFAEAVAGAEVLRLGGYDDWRLPTIKELYSLIRFDGATGRSAATSIPYLDTDFFAFSYGNEAAGERFIDAQFCSSTEYVSTTMHGNPTVFGVNFADGRIKGYPTSDPRGYQKTFYVRYVRGGNGYGVNDFIDNHDGTVMDRSTGLMWAQQDSGVGMTWEDALAWVQEQNDRHHLGYDDWRLPDAKELQSIVDYTRLPATTASPAIDPVFATTAITNEAGEIDYPYFWTSTTHLDGPEISYAVYIAFGRALGYMQTWDGVQLMDVHGAGAQRSDPKIGSPASFPTGHGPQGDVVRVFNFVRLVRGQGQMISSPQGSQRRVQRTRAFSRGEAPTTKGVVGSQRERRQHRPGNRGTRPQGPPSCNDQDDCDTRGACPPDARLGCTCQQTPDAGLRCIPACTSDEDCPSPPEGSLRCDTRQGICVPSFAVEHSSPAYGTGPR